MPTIALQTTPTARAIEDVVAAIKRYTVFLWNDDGSGSGILLGDGRILTNYHVVDGAGTVWARLSDGRQEPVRIVRVDPRRDLALLESSFRATPAAELRDARTLRSLESLIAVGYPRAEVAELRGGRRRSHGIPGGWLLRAVHDAVSNSGDQTRPRGGRGQPTHAGSRWATVADVRHQLFRRAGLVGAGCLAASGGRRRVDQRSAE